MSATNDILFINQDERFRASMIPSLQAAGYTVHAATTMRNALSILATHPVGLIVCDKALDDIGGLEFLGFIKKDPLRENIPVMFLVPLKDQGRPLKLFELGAVDYLVYPLDSDMLIGRIGEAFRSPSRAPSAEKSETVPSGPIGATAPAEPPAATPVDISTIGVEVSRDGLLWMPGNIRGFTDQSISIQTSLFGKKGVSLMIRFKQPEGVFVVNGRIDTIVFDDFQKPADIDILVEQDDSWRRTYHWLTHGGDAAPDAAPPGEISEPALVQGASEIEATIALFPEEDDANEISGEQLQQKAAKKKQSYDIRFYHSIIGKQLDNYRVITLIGAGSMGGVLQGWDVALEREVALKIISFELSSKEEFRELFVKEARVISKLNHPNIAQIYNIGCSSDILYYAMEFVDGITLKDVIARYRKLSLQKGLAVLITVCKALEVVYQNSIVHRDIKPANIMITHSGAIKLVDFGVAHSRDFKPSGKHRIMGTPLYMSPEQIAGLTLDHRSDMYSLGATFYHVLCGAPPFNAKEINDVLDQHLNASIPPLWKRDPKIPSQLSDVIDKMMAKDPNDRYQSFKAVADEISGLRTKATPNKT